METLPKEPNLKNVDQLCAQRNCVMLDLESRGIATRQGTHAPIFQTYYAEKYNLKPDQFPKAYIAERLTLALPMYVELTENEQDFIVESMIQAQREL